MENIKKFQELIARCSLALSALGLASVVLSVFASVLCRYVFKISTMWVDQYTRYMTIWMAFLSANVLIYKLENNETVIVRPSGTEPKIKIYYTTLGKDLAEAQAEKDKLAEALKPIMA